MKQRIKEIVFFLAFIALFGIVGGMEQYFFKVETGAILATVDYIIIAWSGFVSGLLQRPTRRK